MELVEQADTKVLLASKSRAGNPSASLHHLGAESRAGQVAPPAPASPAGRLLPAFCLGPAGWAGRGVCSPPDTTPQGPSKTSTAGTLTGAGFGSPAGPPALTQSSLVLVQGTDCRLLPHGPERQPALLPCFLGPSPPRPEQQGAPRLLWPLLSPL